MPARSTSRRSTASSSANERRRTAARGVLALAIALMSGCYEGFDYQQVGDNPGPGPGPIPLDKPIAYLLFETFALDESALADSRCFPEPDYREFRAAEFALRIEAAKQALSAIADRFVHRPVTITASDCETLRAIETRSVDPAPWGDEPAPTVAPDEKNTIHLKAVFWQTEPSASPASNVKKDDWLAFENLRDDGLRVTSLHYFVIEDGSSLGYFSEWRQGLAKVKGAPELAPDATPEGLTRRDEAIRRDTSELASWVQEYR